MRWGAVDLAGGIIRVRESWDAKEGSIAPKTRTSQRTTPMPGALRDHLMDLRLSVEDAGDDVLVFGAAPDRPFHANVVYRRADLAWRKAGLGRLRLQEARHTYAKSYRRFGSIRREFKVTHHPGFSVWKPLVEPLRSARGTGRRRNRGGSRAAGAAGQAAPRPRFRVGIVGLYDGGLEIAGHAIMGVVANGVATPTAEGELLFPGGLVPYDKIVALDWGRSRCIR